MIRRQAPNLTRKRDAPPVFTIPTILVLLSVGLVALISWGAFQEEARNR